MRHLAKHYRHAILQVIIRVRPAIGKLLYGSVIGPGTSLCRLNVIRISLPAIGAPNWPVLLQNGHIV